MIRTALVLAFLVPYAVVACPLAIGLSWASGSAVPLYSFSSWGLAAAFRIAGIRIAVDDRARLAADPRNTLVVANHVSHLDAPAIYLGLGVRLIAIAKREVFDIPLFSTVLRRAGFISIQRGDRADAAGAVARMTEALKAGACILVFAEGTRSRTGELGPFKKGGFIAATDAGSRVFPVVVHGTRALMPAHGYALRPGRVRISVLDPVDARAYPAADREAIVAEVRRRIAAALDAERGAGAGERSVA
jgi:1-acyl-sn-glycerol-3-phosphate acyltransferase